MNKKVIVFVLVLLLISSVVNAGKLTGWVLNEKEDEMDGTKSYTLMKLSESSIENINVRHDWIIMMFTFDAAGDIIAWGIGHSGFIEDGKVRYKFDNGEIVEENWMFDENIIMKPMMDNEFMKGLAKELKNNNEFKIEYESYNNGLEVETFSLEGISKELEILGW